MRILAADDDISFLDYARELMGILGFSEVRYVQSATAALGEIQLCSEPYECFLLDLQMPGMDGIELTRQIRRQEKHARTPILMITSERQRGLIDAAFDAGITDYVTKPLDLHQLRGRLGLARQLWEEQKQVRALSALVEKAAHSESPQIEFGQPLPLAVSGFVDYLSMENYLLTLGRVRSFDLAAICLRVENAEQLFERLPQDEYLSVLRDVAAVVEDHLKNHGAMMSYAGSGDFVCLVRRGHSRGLDEIQREINAAIGRLPRQPGRRAHGLPVVVCGRPAHARLSLRARPTWMLEDARRSVRRDRFLQQDRHEAVPC